MRKKCKRSIKRWRKKAHDETRFRALSERSGDSRKAAAELENEILNLQASEERRGCIALQTNGCCFDPAIFEQVLTVGAAQAMQQLAYVHGEVTRVFGGQHWPEPTAPARGAGAEEKEAWAEDWDDERMANGWYERSAFGSAVDPFESSDAVGGSFGEGNPSTPRNGTRARDSSRSLREKRDKENDKNLP